MVHVDLAFMCNIMKNPETVDAELQAKNKAWKKVLFESVWIACTKFEIHCGAHRVMGLEQKKVKDQAALSFGLYLVCYK